MQLSSLSAGLVQIEDRVAVVEDGTFHGRVTRDSPRRHHSVRFEIVVLDDCAPFEILQSYARTPTVRIPVVRNPSGRRREP